MIEHLDGIYETVAFPGELGLRIHRLEACEQFPPHWHTPVEIIRCTGNWYGITVDERRDTLGEGDIGVIRPGAIHALTAPQVGSRTICLLQPAAQVETILALLPPVTVLRAGAAGHAEVLRLLGEVEDEYDAARPYRELMLAARLTELFALLGRGRIHDAPGKSAQPAKYAGRMLDVCRYINAHCTEDLTLDDAAAVAGFSKYHFSRLFRQFAHTTFYQYLGKQRIALAGELLVNPDYTVTEVALRSGFSSMSSFTRMFHRMKGCTPSEFRGMYAP